MKEFVAKPFSAIVCVVIVNQGTSCLHGLEKLGVNGER